MLDFNTTFNQAIVELKRKMADIEKLERFVPLIKPLWNWNKQDRKCNDACYRPLIKPLWNWNVNIVNVRNDEELAFNQAIVELKHVISTFRAVVATSFNQAIVELKQNPILYSV